MFRYVQMDRDPVYHMAYGPILRRGDSERTPRFEGLHGQPGQPQRKPK